MFNFKLLSQLLKKLYIVEPRVPYFQTPFEINIFFIKQWSEMYADIINQKCKNFNLIIEKRSKLGGPAGPLSLTPFECTISFSSNGPKCIKVLII